MPDDTPRPEVARSLAHAEAFRVLRNRLKAAGDPRLVAVSSARQDEGADECAVNLAIALAERPGSRVLLVDAHPGEGRLAPLLAFPEAAAVRHATEGRDSQRLDIRPTALPPPCRLDFGSVLRPSDQAPLDGLGLTANLRDLQRLAYDYIIIAAPPVLSSCDANYVADGVDGMLLSVRAGRSRASSLRRSLRRLAPSRILGVALLER